MSIVKAYKGDPGSISSSIQEKNAVSRPGDGRQPAAVKGERYPCESVGVLVEGA
jgi:hypothetical protein